jgi:hypothetical protein
MPRAIEAGLPVQASIHSTIKAPAFYSKTLANATSIESVEIDTPRASGRYLIKEISRALSPSGHSG